MKRTFKLIMALFCVVVILLGCVSCGASKPMEATLRQDVESFLSYFGALPFKYDFTEFSIDAENLQSKYRTYDTTVKARVETYYEEELFSDFTYMLTLSYAKNYNDQWILQFATIQESEQHKGFDAQSVFMRKAWHYSEADSFAMPDDLQAKNVPTIFSFSGNWETDAFSVTTTQVDEKSESRLATYWGISGYIDRYSARIDWDFRLTYKLPSGDALDLVHLSGCDLSSSASWVVGYRATTNDTYNTAIYQLNNE